MIPIEKSVPMTGPNPWRSGGVQPNKKYPLAELEVGDSFVAPRVALSTMRSHNARTEKKFEHRTLPFGKVRIWRIK